MNFKKTFLFLLAALLCSMTSMAEGIFSTQYGEKWVTIQGVGITTRYAYVDGTTLKHGTISDITNPGDAYLWCFVGDASSCRIYNKSLGQTYQVSQSSSATSSITLSTSNSGTFTLGTSDSYSGYSIKPTDYTQYWNLYGGSDWSSTHSAAPIGYWSSVDQHSMWTIATTYNLVFTTESATDESDDPTVYSGSFADLQTLEKYWELCPKANPAWRSRMGNTQAERRQNMEFSNGTLKLHAKKVASATDGTEKFITSGIQTFESYQYGIFEIKAKVLGVHTGNFPALWMMPTGLRNEMQLYGEAKWPDCGEIDIMEMINDSYTAYGTLHNATCTCNGGSGSYSGTTTADAEYHVYTLVWEEDQLTWYMDGVQFYQYTKNSTDAFPYNKPYFIIINQSCGNGGWAANADESFDYEMDVEYVRVYQNESGEIYPEDKVPVFQTYTRNNATAGDWQSFALPLRTRHADLKYWFDEIAIPFNGDQCLSFDECEGEDMEGPAEGEGAVDLAPLRRAAGTETYNEEDGSWDDETGTGGETASDGDYDRNCFAYSAENSRYYHLFLADYADDKYLEIQPGTPFFAHVRTDVVVPSNTLVLDGYLSETEIEEMESAETSNDTYGIGLIVYSETTLQTYYEAPEEDPDAAPAKQLEVVGVLSEDFSNVDEDIQFFKMNTDGSFSKVDADDMQVNHAYVAAKNAKGILNNIQTIDELNALTEISVSEPLELHLTDAAPTLIAGTYAAGNITYTRDVTGKNYAGFYLPFDLDLSSLPESVEAVYTLAGFAINNFTVEPQKQTTFYKTADMNSILPAYTPFMAALKSTAELVRFEGYGTTVIESTADREPIEMDVYDYGYNGGLTRTSTYFKIYYGGALNYSTHEKSEGYYTVKGSSGGWGYCLELTAYKAYIIMQSISSAGVAPYPESSIIDAPTSIEDIILVEPASAEGIYDILGRKLSESEYNTLPAGIYIQNGKKVFKF